MDTCHAAGTGHVATKADLDTLELRMTIKLYTVAGAVIGLAAGRGPKGQSVGGGACGALRSLTPTRQGHH